MLERIREIHAANYFVYGSWRMWKALLRAGEQVGRDRVWRTRTQLELAVVEYVAWFNNERLHTSLGGIPPAEYERHHARR